jgi:hypothetical protein
MARLVGLSREQFRYRWRRQLVTEVGPREFLDRVFALRAFQVRSELGTWESVAEQLAVDKKTLRRIRANALAGSETHPDAPIQERLIVALERCVTAIISPESGPSLRSDPGGPGGWI